MKKIIMISVLTSLTFSLFAVDKLENKLINNEFFPVIKEHLAKDYSDAFIVKDPPGLTSILLLTQLKGLELASYLYYSYNLYKDKKIDENKLIEIVGQSKQAVEEYNRIVDGLCKRIESYPVKDSFGKKVYSIPNKRLKFNASVIIPVVSVDYIKKSKLSLDKIYLQTNPEEILLKIKRTFINCMNSNVSLRDPKEVRTVSDFSDALIKDIYVPIIKQNQK